ncbi:hypothetical protein M5K25_015385 [Dendrobium thyrsiflorum]|uniref:GRF-type domain-containing protein n=1 Tax=Dendrobium thyrsiflorum TaxID=117978 RepID=A0ABD0UR10_DENTH
MNRCAPPTCSTLLPPSDSPAFQMLQRNAALELTEQFHPKGYPDPPCEFIPFPISLTSAPSLTPTGSHAISSPSLPSLSPSKHAGRDASSCEEPKVHSLQLIQSLDSHSGDVIPCWIDSGTQQEEEESSVPIEPTFRGNGDNEDEEPSRPLKLVITEPAKHCSEKTLEDMIERDWRVFHENCNIFYQESRIPLPMHKWSQSKLSTKLLKEVEKAGCRSSQIFLAALLSWAAYLPHGSSRRILWLSQAADCLTFQMSSTNLSATKDRRTRSRVYCHCHLNCVLYTCHRGPYSGRKIYRCINNRTEDDCRYFKWIDEVEDASYGTHDEYEGFEAKICKKLDWIIFLIKVFIATVLLDIAIRLWLGSILGKNGLLQLLDLSSNKLTDNLSSDL